MDFQFDLDPGVRRIATKMQWIHSLINIKYFTEFRENWPVTAKNTHNKSPKMS